DHAGIGKLTQKIIPRIGNLVSAPRAEPHVKMDRFHLALKPCWICVITLWQGHCFRDSDFRTSIGVGPGHQPNIAIKPTPLKHGGKEGPEENWYLSKL